MKLNKQTAFIAAAAAAILFFLVLPCVNVMGKINLNGFNLLFDGTGKTAFIALLFIAAPGAAIALKLKKPELSKYAVWGMYLPTLLMFIQNGCSPKIGLILYLVLAIFLTALPYINQIPEE